MIHRPAIGAGLASVLVLAALPAHLVRAQRPCWTQIDQDDNKSGNSLSGVAVLDLAQAWVSGSTYTDRGSSRTLVRVWNGNKWNRQNTPEGSTNNTFLEDIDVGRKRALWAVGDYSGNTMKTFAIRRTSRGWKRTDSQNPSSSLSSFQHVAVLSNKRVFAVGTRWAPNGDHLVLIERWNGRRWRVEPPSITGLLQGAYIGARDDAWAVGNTVRRNVSRTLTLRFNGRRWRKERSPNDGRKFHTLYAVDGDGRNVWAVGYRFGRRTRDVPIAMRRKAGRWRLVDLPSFGRRSEAVLRGVSVRGSEVVAVGDYYKPREGFLGLIVTWNGNSWNQVDTSKFEESIELHDVEHAPNGEVFVAGYRTTSNGSEVILHRAATC